MPGFMPGIHAFLAAKTWMAGTSPAMTRMAAIVRYCLKPVAPSIIKG
jgi:hypothetical protein